MGQWNQFLWPLIITNSANMRTLPVGLAAQEGTPMRPLTGQQRQFP